jgi:hypothetical protein
MRGNELNLFSWVISQFTEIEGLGMPPKHEISLSIVVDLPILYNDFDSFLIPMT